MRKSFIGIFHIACLFALGAFAAIQTSSPSLNKALEAQIALVQKNPNSADALNDLGNLLELANRRAEAEAAYRRAIELADHKVLPHFNLGLLLQQAGKREEALAEFHRVVELNPEHAWGHYQIGAIYEGQGLKDKAVAAYTRAFSLDYDLTRPSVNPHIIENHLVVEAMLKAYRQMAVQPLAPKSYKDAVRIVDLMVNEPPLPDVAAEEGDTLAEEGSAARGGTGEVPRQARFGDDEEDEGGDSSGGRVLNQETLRQNPGARKDINASGGVLVGGGSSSRGRSTTTTSGRSSTPTPSRGSTVAPRSDGRSNTIRRPTEPSRTRRGPGFIPSTGSTGRLDWQLRPAPPRGSEPAG